MTCLFGRLTISIHRSSQRRYSAGVEHGIPVCLRHFGVVDSACRGAVPLAQFDVSRHQADCETALRGLALNADWLRHKLDVTNIAAWLADCAYAPDGDEPLRLVRSALSLSAHVLSREG